MACAEPVTKLTPIDPIQYARALERTANRALKALLWVSHNVKLDAWQREGLNAHMRELEIELLITERPDKE